MAAHGGQFCTSVLVPYVVLCVGFSLPRDFLQLPEDFFCESSHKIFLQTSYRLYIFRKINQTIEKSDKTASKTYFRTPISARLILTVSLSSFNNLARFLEYMAIMNPWIMNTRLCKIGPVIFRLGHFSHR